MSCIKNQAQSTSLPNTPTKKCSSSKNESFWTFHSSNKRGKKKKS